VEGAVEAVHHTAGLGMTKGVAGWSDGLLPAAGCGLSGIPSGLKHIHPS